MDGASRDTGTGTDGSGLTLALNAAESFVQIAVADGNGRCLYGQQIYAASRGVELLAPALDAAFTLLGETPRSVSRVAVVRGPGGFTGLRLATVTAAGLARAVGARQGGINYMELLAREYEPSLHAAEPDTILWILVRARRGLVYMQAFGRGQKDACGIRAVTELEVRPVAPENEAAARILETARLTGCSGVILAGDGLEDNDDAFARGLAAPGAPRVVNLPARNPGPETLLAAALAAEYGDTDIEPLYVRPSDAEENLPHIARRLGNDPQKAAQRLFDLTHAGPQDAENG